MSVDHKEENNVAVDDPYYACWSYERLLLLQSHIQVTGLWKKDNWFYAVCPDLSADLMAADGSPLEQWFDYAGRVASTPIRLVVRQPEGATRVPERTPDEVATLVGYPLTVRDVRAVGVGSAEDLPGFRFPHFTSAGFCVRVATNQRR